MKAKTLLLLSLLCPLTACATSHTGSQADPLEFQPFELQEQARTGLLDAIKALEGNWSTEDGSTTRFEVTSANSVVRETLFEGLPHEMTNMYSLEGNALSMTHYCGAGNQPHMRATALEQSKIVFSSTGVSGRKQADENYMGSMTLTLIDEDTIEQSWTSHVGTQATEQKMVFTYHRTD